MALERINSDPRMTQFLVDRTLAFSDRPLLVLDLGARGGFEPHWKFYGDRIIQIGFEPDLEECEKLNQQFGDRGLKFYPVALGQRKEKRNFSVCQWGGSSSFYPANTNFLRRFPDEHGEQMKVIKTIELETVDLDSFATEEGIEYIDFIKLDIEGSELDVLKGAVEFLQRSVLGLSIEVLFHSSLRNQPTFSEIDLFLSSLGFQLFDLATYRHARKALPLPANSLGVTQQGQLLWGQALYLRDGVNEIESEQGIANWDHDRVLKLATLMEIFCLPDCAIELIQTGVKKGILTENMETAIDYLTPPIEKGNKTVSVSYQEYVQLAQKKSRSTAIKEAIKATPIKCYAQKRDLFEDEYLSELRSQILSSPYLSASQLSEGFAGTKGFSVIFKRSGMAEVERQFPFFAPYLKIALKQACNAFYLNPLVLEGETRVEPHVDCSISSYDMVYTNPNLVSVLYVQVPEDIQGGELVLQPSEDKVIQIQPRRNTLIYFLGNLMHSVNEVKCSEPRISLICEQYNLDQTRLEKIPEFEIKSGVDRNYD
ncbi:MAG: FkbM family methyltransferase [Prochloraceae cyanobacterium]|nr:FkbM family methyltransferase [Prochloraceae cyanobacterium]